MNDLEIMVLPCLGYNVVVPVRMVHQTLPCAPLIPAVDQPECVMGNIIVQEKLPVVELFASEEEARANFGHEGDRMVWLKSTGENEKVHGYFLVIHGQPTRLMCSPKDIEDLGPDDMERYVARRVEIPLLSNDRGLPSVVPDLHALEQDLAG